jgi:hypothetical protein
VLWCFGALALIASLIDLVVRNELSVSFLLQYYALFLLFFAFVYNLIGWHLPGAIEGLRAGWAGELQCLIMSVQVMTTGDYTSAKPAKPISEVISAVQCLLGILFIAVFVAKAVGLLTPGAVSR